MRWIAGGTGRLERILNASCFLIVMIASGCAESVSSEAPLFFFSAASTRDAVSEAIETFEKETGLDVKLNIASSSTLAQQILAGASADLFLSAHPDWTQELAREGRVVRRRFLLSNRLVLVVPREGVPMLKSPDDLARDSVDRISIGDPTGVPAGIYARQVLERLGLWKVVEAKIVRAFDVRQALLFVETGDVQAGIVYATDAALSDRVETVFEFDSKLSEPICYPLVLIQPARAQAEQLFEFLLRPRTTDLFRRYGFSRAAEGVCEGEGKS